MTSVNVILAVVSRAGKTCMSGHGACLAFFTILLLFLGVQGGDAGESLIHISEHIFVYFTNVDRLMIVCRPTL